MLYMFFIRPIGSVRRSSIILAFACISSAPNLTCYCPQLSLTKTPFVKKILLAYFSE
ncbi:hypothetical protein NC651_005854 [Populus alba x Populus x berolinensis]|nr:hypothetical protein NC651_005854 [Populus alba x Populus x berolinensis]